jgi:hypothetical protein
MKEWLVTHGHSFGAFSVMLVIAMLMAGTMGTQFAGAPLLALPSAPVPMPLAADDADLDTYADDVDVIAGDAMVQLTLRSLDAGQIAPYFLIGTDDDQWRFGAGRALEWLHIVDADPLGWKPGSNVWQSEALRTGAWWRSIPGEGLERAIAHTGVLDDQTNTEHWPQTFFLNVRDDQRVVAIDIDLYDARSGADGIVAKWRIQVDLVGGSWTPDGAAWAAGDRIIEASGARLGLSVQSVTETSHEVRESVANRWAPELRFDQDERFFPTSGESLARVHGFTRTTAHSRNLQTWTPEFNNGRDNYVLLLADFDGDRLVNHKDAAIMSELLREGGNDRVYHNAFTTTQGRFVVQYWMIYMYNFVQNAGGNPIENLAHIGDREFVSLTFASLEAAQSGTPMHISYSQHYRGIRIEQPSLTAAPFIDNGTHFALYVARGSHASFPEAGDDERLKPALTAYWDRFDGEGERWVPGNYTLEALGNQEWAFGHLWGPPTRYSRTFGTTLKPLLMYDFSYPYTDPTSWEPRLAVLEANELKALYGGHA